MAARIPTVPPLLAATASWPPNAAVARRNLAPLGVAVAEVADDAPLPYPDATFDLAVSRHPVSAPWPEIARVLRPGGTFLSQQIGAGTNHALSEALMGPLPVGAERSTERAVTAAEAAGLEIIDLRTQSLRVTFDDVGAVVHFLRKVLWTVPGLTVDGYREQLAALHERIQAGGPFVSQSERFLIEARKPG